MSIFLEKFEPKKSRSVLCARSLSVAKAESWTSLDQQTPLPPLAALVHN